jgi:hypothetical protein
VRELAAISLLLIIAVPAGAIEDGQVMCVGGSLSGLQAGLVGHLDMTSATALTFEYAGNKVTIPYANIDSFRYYDQVARHLGVLPAIAVGLVKKRQRRHFVQISYRDDSNSIQVVIFEVSKHMPRALLGVLQVRAPQGCRVVDELKCGQALLVSAN